MKNAALLLIYAAAVIAGMVLSFLAALMISDYRRKHQAKYAVLTVLLIAAIVCGGYVTAFVSGGFIEFLMGVIVGVMPFFHVFNRETEDQIKATNRDRAEREKKYEEQKAKRAEKK